MIDHYIVAFSGGADSVCAAHEAAASGKAMSLFYLHHYPTPVEPQRLAVFAETRMRYPHAIWVEEQADVSQIAKRLGYSWEHTASLIRRKRLLRLRAAITGSEVVTGHNYSDYLETIALRRARKIPDELLPALADRSEDTGFLRPLSNKTREEVRIRVAALGFRWFEDPANADTNVARNRLRLSPTARQTPALPVIRSVNAEACRLSDDFSAGSPLRQRRELRLSYSRWSGLARVEKARTLFVAFRRLAIVRKFTPNHFARAHKLPFALAPFFAHREGDSVIFRRGLGQDVAPAIPAATFCLRGDAVRRSLTIRLPYGRKSVAKIFSERKLSPRERKQTLVYLQPGLPNRVIRIVFPDRREIAAVPL